MDTAWELKHPTKSLGYAKAIGYVENWLNENHLTDEARERSFAWHIYDYYDRTPAKRKERKWVGVRVAEIDCSCPNAGASYMQTDMPWGIAFCGQVERCIIALIECWNDGASADGPNYGETDEEFWRLNNLLEAANKETT
jgi:hypothetical protein